MIIISSLTQIIGSLSWKLVKNYQDFNKKNQSNPWIWKFLILFAKFFIIPAVGISTLHQKNVLKNTEIQILLWCSSYPHEKIQYDCTKNEKIIYQTRQRS